MPAWTEPRLLDDVLDHLRSGPDSISGLARRLSEGRAHPIHRLTVAGYLMALADLGLVREADRPPSKQYRLTHADLARDPHGFIGRVVLEEGHDPATAVGVGVAALCALFGRPVFQSEVRHAGLHGPTHGLTTAGDDATRRAIRAALARRAHPRIEVPRGDPLLLPREADRGAADRVIARALLAATHADHLAPERTPRQAALGETP